MKAIQVRKLKKKETKQLREALKSSAGTVVRHSQVILASAEEGMKAKEIGDRIGYSDQTVRQIIHRFNSEGISAIYPKSRARHDDQRAFDDEAREALKGLVHRSPREFGYESSLWSLELLAQASYAQGLTDRVVHLDTVSETLHQLGIGWKKAKRHLQSPDENYDVKKNDAIGSK